MFSYRVHDTKNKFKHSCKGIPSLICNKSVSHKVFSVISRPGKEGSEETGEKNLCYMLD
jgi:hypothetical protein